MMPNRIMCCNIIPKWTQRRKSTKRKKGRNLSLKYVTHRNSQTTSSGINTKRAAKRRKAPKPPKRVTNPTAEVVKQVAQFNTNCVVADENTEKRLSRYGPPTGRQYDGMQFVW